MSYLKSDLYSTIKYSQKLHIKVLYLNTSAKQASNENKDQYLCSSQSYLDSG